MTAIDNVRDYWPNGLVNRHWMVTHDDITQANGGVHTYDVVLCISVLEHIADPLAAIRGLHHRTKPGGTLLFDDALWCRRSCERLYGAGQLWRRVAVYLSPIVPR